MSSWCLPDKSNTENILLKLVLVLVLLFAIIHISRHDLPDEEGTHLQSDCQTCRLVQLDGTGTPLIPVNTPLFACSGTPVFLATSFFSCLPVYSRNARAPPSL